MRLLALLPLSLAAFACAADRAPATATASADPLSVDASAPPATAATAASKEVADGGAPVARSVELGGGLGLTRAPGPSTGPTAVKVKAGTFSVSGRLPPEAVQRVVKQGFGRFRLCYEEGLRRSPEMQGRVQVRFVIGRDGTPATAAADTAASDLADPAVIACVVHGFTALSFPPTEGGIALVTFPLLFAPPDVAPPAATALPEPTASAAPRGEGAPACAPLPASRPKDMVFRSRRQWLPHGGDAQQDGIEVHGAGTPCPVTQGPRSDPALPCKRVSEASLDAIFLAFKQRRFDAMHAGPSENPSPHAGDRYLAVMWGDRVCQVEDGRSTSPIGAERADFSALVDAVVGAKP